MKPPFIIYTDVECLLKKWTLVMVILKNHQQLKNMNIKASGYSVFTHCSFDTAKNKLDCYRGKDCMENFCKDLKEHATKTVNCEKKK